MQVYVGGTDKFMMFWIGGEGGMTVYPCLEIWNTAGACGRIPTHDKYCAGQILPFANAGVGDRAPSGGFLVETHHVSRGVAEPRSESREHP